MKIKLSVKLLLVLSATTAITAGVVGVFAFQSIRSALSQSISERQLEAARETMNTIDRLMYERYQDIQSIAGEEAITQSVLGTLGTHETEDAQRRIIKLLSLTGPWDTLFIVDSSGVIVLSTDQGEIGEFITLEPNSKTAYQAALAGEIYFSDVVIFDDTGQQTVIFAAPIRNKDDIERSVVGVAISNLSWPTIGEILEDRNQRIHLHNSEGIVIASSEKGVESGLGVNYGSHPAIKLSLEGESGSGEFSDLYGGELALISYTPQLGYLDYKGSGWVLTIDTPVRIALASASITAFQLTVLIVILVVVTGVLVLFMITRLVIKPVISLTQTAQAIAAGDLAKRATVTSRDEVGQLAIAFNEMTDKVATRTKELLASNKRLQEIAQTLTIARTELERAIAEKGEFLNIAAHELRTPLQPIIGYVSRLLSTSTLTQLQREKLNIVLESADRLLRLVQDILDINKMETGAMKFSMKETDLLRLIKDVYESLKPSAEAKKLGFVLDSPKTLSKVRGDPQRLTQVFSNLIDNAVRFTERGSVTIAVQEDKNTVKISIADTGIGISEKDIGKLFTKFFQAEYYLQREHEGTGLGLAICKEIVKAHGGEISVESTLGKGSTFRVVLPKLTKGKRL